MEGIDSYLKYSLFLPNYVANLHLVKALAVFNIYVLKMS